MEAETAAMHEAQNSTFSTIDGLKLHYEVTGSGMHPIICIPAAVGGAKKTFGPQRDYLGREGSGFKMVTFEPRGNVAYRPAEHFDPNNYVADAKNANALMQSLSLPTFSVLGICSGGIVAMYLAAMFPENIKRLVIWSTNAYVTKEDMAIYDNLRCLSNWKPKAQDLLLKVHGPALQNLWSTYIDNISKIFNEGGDICKGELNKIKCPTLIIHGAKDPVVPCMHAHYLHEHVNGSRLEVMEEGKHYIHLQYSEEFNKMVEDFLK